MNTTSKRAFRIAFPKSSGMTLVEILIALLILSIGLLGLASLQTLSLKFNTSAYYRTQATQLAYDFADRMRANRQAALDGDYAIAAFEDPPPACVAFVGGGTQAQNDKEAWRNALACRIPQSTGRVVPNGAEFTISVQWTDSADANTTTLDFTTSL
jgi:type IV pilus assembly protein PilV